MIFYVEAKHKEESNDRYRDICSYHSKELANLAVKNLETACPNWDFKTRDYKVGGFAIK